METKIKAGFKTTEFWVAILGSIGATIAAIADAIPAESAGWLVVVANGLYAISRGLAKKQA